MGEVRLVDVREDPLDVAEVTKAVEDARAGGVVTFTGAVRDHDSGGDHAAVRAAALPDGEQAAAARAELAVTGLSYSAHPTALERMQAVAEQVAESADVVAVAAVHRVGDLAVGDLAVVVAASAAHREQAFDAARALIDTLKATVPIWKHQRFADGTDEWVGTP